MRCLVPIRILLTVLTKVKGVCIHQGLTEGLALPISFSLEASDCRKPTSGSEQNYPPRFQVTVCRRPGPWRALPYTVSRIAAIGAASSDRETQA